LAEIVLIAGSPSRPSRSTAVLRALRRSLPPQRGVAEVHVRDLPAGPLLRGEADEPEIARAAGLLDGARAVVVVTPVYKAAYSGLLKTFLDLLPTDALAGKVVLPLATGGSPGHRLALEYALKPVLSALGARHVLAGAFIADDQALWNGAAVCGGDDGAAFELDAAALARLERAAEELEESLRRADASPQSAELIAGGEI